MPERPMINFAVHQLRAGMAGAHEDFEQMIALLVRAVSGQDARLVIAPVSWGIDVLLGDLHGPVSVWQAKYLMGELGRNRLDQLRWSFNSAAEAAAQHGYPLERWVLCVPSRIDGRAAQWWHEWKAEQTNRTGVTVDLWDEEVMRELLLRPEASHIYRHYFASHDAGEPGLVVPEQPMINFAAHQVRAGLDGAREDFEQMIGLLAASAHDGRPLPAPGRWGINALVTEEAGDLTAWHSEYFIKGVRRTQINQITSSFAVAADAAAAHGDRLQRWVLCVPSSMDGPTTQWWHEWKADQNNRTGVAVDLWDETVLREYLLRPESTDIYRQYYAPSLPPQAVLNGEEATPEAASNHAFISYVREDTADVDALQKRLETAGIPVWRDTSNLWPGEDWRAKIRDAISRNALVFIACFSSHSTARKQSYQNEELLLGIEQLRRRRPDDPWLIPVRFDNCDIPDYELGAGRTLASLHRADLFGANRELEAQRLVEAVQRLLQ